MKNLIIIVALLATSMCMVSCGYNNDLFGVTDRAQIRANAAIAVAEAHRDEAVGVAHEDASASRAWAGTLPFVVLIVVAGSVIALIVNWQGRIYFERTKRMVQAPGQATPMMIEPPRYVEIAAQHWRGIA